MKSKQAGLAVLGAAGAVILSVSATAHAQQGAFERGSFVPADEQANPEVDPVPFPVGIFIVQPSVDFSADWSSNVLATATAEESATAFGFKPTFLVSSDWARHGLGGILQIDHVENPDVSSESFTDVKLGLNGQLDLAERSTVMFRVLTEDITEDRTAFSTIAGALEPNEYTRSGGGVGLQHESRKWQIETGVDLFSFDHDDAELPGDLFQDQDLRDRDELEGRVRLAYAMSSSWAAYAEARRLEADFDPPNIFNAFNRDYEGSIVSLGSDFEFGDSLRGDIGIGFMSYTYNDPSYADIEDVSVSANVQWALADKTTIETAVSRDIIDPGIAADIAAVETGVNVRLAHGLSSKVFLVGGAGFNTYEFENIDRTDDRVDVLVGANWKLNKNLWLESNYEIRDSSSPIQEYTENRVLFRMRVFP
jgi:hypothetical protein